MSEPKFCRDCRHRIIRPTEFSKCAKTGISNPVYLVTGEGDPILHTYCTTERQMRGDPNSCGPEAKWFEAKAEPSELEQAIAQAEHRKDR